MSRKASIGHFIAVSIAAVLAVGTVFLVESYAAESYKVIYSFDGSSRLPATGVIPDANGNFLGVADGQGISINIFKVTPSGAFSVLASPGGTQGGGLSIDKDGAIYGTTANYEDDIGYVIDSSVFKFQPSGGLQILYRFGDYYDKSGTDPYGRVAIDAQGHVFGTTSDAYPSYGLVYKITDGKEQIMHGFGGPDGVFPSASAIVLDESHNLYGTTYYGGAFDKGVVFKIAPDRTYTVLHSFAGADGANPAYGVILDKDGNIYGNTSAGGTYNKGVIFKITPSGTTTTLYSFKGIIGINPNGPLIRDAAGNLYGTAQGGLHQKGTVYQITLGGQAFVLHSFGDSAIDGVSPSGRLAYDGSGYLYGTTVVGGKNGYGTVFRVPK